MERKAGGAKVTEASVTLGLDDDLGVTEYFWYVGDARAPTWVCDYCLHPAGGEPSVVPATAVMWDAAAARPTMVCEAHRAEDLFVADPILEERAEDGDDWPWLELRAARAMLPESEGAGAGCLRGDEETGARR